MMEEKKEETKSSPIPVDRNWLAKLLLCGRQEQHQQHQHGNNEQHLEPPVTRSIPPALVLAPMVDQSDLAFRILTRKYGCNLAFTPMIHAKLLVTSVEYRRKFALRSTSTTSIDDNDNDDLESNHNHSNNSSSNNNYDHTDRPLIAQLCGSDPETVLQAALLLAPHCDAIDINCGCPQGIAKRGNYGAFLLEQETVLLRLVRHLVQHLPIPLTVKVRLLPGQTRNDSIQKSLQLYRKLVDAGVHLLTIHGRTRHHKGPDTGHADWDAIRQVVNDVGDRIPIFANGSIGCYQDVLDCLEQTGADGVMISEAILEYPALLSQEQQCGQPRTIGRVALTLEYLKLAQQYPPEQNGQGSGMKCIRSHVHRMLHADLEDLTIRQRIIDAPTLEELLAAVEWLAEQHHLAGHKVEEERLSWYMRHRHLVQAQVSGLTMTVSEAKKESESAVRRADLVDDAADCFSNLFDGDDDDDDDDDDDEAY